MPLTIKLSVKYIAGKWRLHAPVGRWIPIRYFLRTNAPRRLPQKRSAEPLRMAMLVVDSGDGGDTKGSEIESGDEEEVGLRVASSDQQHSKPFRCQKLISPASITTPMIH